MTLRKPPAAWPKWPLISLRIAQLVGILIVFGIMGYFNYNLQNDGYSIPWEFIVVDVVAVFTLFNILCTSILLGLGRLKTLPLVIVEGVLALCWAIAFGVLARAMGKTTIETCDIYNWGSQDGIRICHMFKSLFAFTLLSWAFNLGTFAFVSTIRSREKKHEYEPAFNPANLHAQGTAYKPGHVSSDSIAYTSTPPPVYTAVPDYTAGRGDTPYA